MLKDKNILIGITGGISCYKILELCSRLKKKEANLKIVMTEAATKFVTPLSFETMGKCEVYTDLFSGTHSKVHHVELGKWADVFLIAPLSANTMAKITYGIADNFLTSTYLAYDKNLIVAPSMNTNMLNNPATQKNISILKQRGVRFIESESGMLACNTVGDGRLREPIDIVDYLEYYFTKKDLVGKNIVITAGPTVSKIDYVRYITNHSSGKMGYNIALSARNRGANVTLITGPVHPFDINGIDIINISSNDDLKNAIDSKFDDCDALIMAAAPIDYKIENYVDRKIKKDGNNLELKLIESDDILRYFGLKKKNQKIIGFAAETDDLIANATKKLNSKKADYIVANNLKTEDAGFDVDTNIASIISKDGVKNYPKMLKSELSDVILDLVGD